MAGKIQNADIKSEAELLALGADKTKLPHASKIYVSKTGIDEILQIILRKNNYSATTNPAAGDDSADGYEVGSEWINTSTDKKYTCMDNTAAAAVWKESGSGGSGGINFITNGDGEGDLTGIVVYKDAAGTEPVDGTGQISAPGITLAVNTTNPMRGVGDFKITKPASNCQGEGVSIDFTVSRGYLPAVLRAMLNYRFTSGAVDGDVRIYLRNVTQSRNIRVDRENLDSTELATNYMSSFQTDAASVAETYRLIIHFATTSAVAFDLYFDDVIVGPSQVARGPVFAGPFNYPAGTVWASTGTQPAIGNGTLSAKYWIAANKIRCEIEIVAGTTTTFGTGIYEWRLPSGMTTHANTVQNGNVSVGNGAVSVFDDSAGVIIHGMPTNAGPNLNYVNARVFNSTTNQAALTSTNPFTLANLDRITVHFEVEVNGLQNTQAISEDYGQRHILTTLLKSATQSINNATETKVSFSSASKDTVAAFDEPNDRILIKESGDYDVLGVIQFASTAVGGKSIHVRKNGSITDQGYMWYNIGSASVGAPSNVSGHTLLTNLIAGDYLEFWAAQDSGGALNINGGNTTFTVAKRSSNQQIAASEILVARATTNAGQSINSAAETVVVYEDIVQDSHLSINTSTGEIEAKISGTYEFNAMNMFSNHTAISNGIYYLRSFLDGVGYAQGVRTIAQNLANVWSCGITFKVKMNKGQKITIKAFQNSGSAQTLLGSAETNYVEVTKVGGIA